jgi:hypothetical protein
MENDTIVKISVIITLGLVLISAIIILGIVAIHTDRSLGPPAALVFVGMIILGLLGGVSWWRNGHRHWRVRVDRNGHEEGGE